MRRCSPGQAGEPTSLYDGATGLYGRAVFEILGEELMEQSRRYHVPLTLAMYSTGWSDSTPRDPETLAEALQYMGLLFVESLRRCDVAAHMGDGQFALLMPYTAYDQACEVAERMRQTIISSPVILRSGEQVQMIASTGVAVFEKRHFHMEELFREAAPGTGLTPVLTHKA